MLHLPRETSKGTRQKKTIVRRETARDYQWHEKTQSDLTECGKKTYRRRHQKGKTQETPEKSWKQSLTPAKSRARTPSLN